MPFDVVRQDHPAGTPVAGQEIVKPGAGTICTLSMAGCVAPMTPGTVPEGGLLKRNVTTLCRPANSSLVDVIDAVPSSAANAGVAGRSPRIRTASVPRTPTRTSLLLIYLASEAPGRRRGCGHPPYRVWWLFPVSRGVGFDASGRI